MSVITKKRTGDNAVRFEPTACTFPVQAVLCVYTELRIISTGRFLLIILIGITDETSVRATVISGMIRQIAMLGIIISNGFSASEAAYILLIYIVSTTSIT